MCVSRTRSSGCILDFSRPCYLVAEVVAKVFRRTEIDFPAAEESGEFQLDTSKAEEARGLAGLKFNQQINVAVSAIGASEHGAEERQTANAVSLANLG